MIVDDGDIVRALGFVTLYSSYLEEQIELLVKMLEPIKPYSKGWQVSDKITHAKKAIRKMNCSELSGLVEDLCTCSELFLERNELTHGRIFGGVNRPDTLKSSRLEISERQVNSEELYQLANEFWMYISAIYRPMIFDLPKAINVFLNIKS
ncbi:MAG: hypothetical protein KJ930_13195 [Gammaproteobacteria bacterium]|nr:hypothetical protein [Gammaproteobacteria bacterium]MBU2225134.1 hypothetical protein [Gammaproteobacteria bacterium]MBU2279793.1 hypothetical protein [Gammaproteobacteria bacterium]